jgi:hypothetical protein
MYVMSVVDPAEFQFYDKYDATAYWCTKTQKPLGPDGKPAHASACQDGRGVLFALDATDRPVSEGAKAKSSG